MTATTRQVSSKSALFGIVLIWAVAQASGIVAHELWISRGGHRNPAGAWCCDNHCQQREHVAVTARSVSVSQSLPKPQVASPKPRYAFLKRMWRAAQLP